MATRSDLARDALVARRKATDGVSVTYTRGTTSAVLTAIPGATVYSSIADGGARVEIGQRDYLIAVADLVLGGVVTAPAIGDRIQETVNGQALVFECQTPDNGEPAFRYGSQWRGWYRLHTKRV